MYATSGIPEEVKKILIPAIEKAVKITKPRVDRMGSITEYKSPAELKKMTDEEYKVAVEVAKNMGLRK
jgi:tripartite-type tricarboxylate transporter receptor subunit TctC